MILERGIPIAHTTIIRWVSQYAPVLEENQLHILPHHPIIHLPNRLNRTGLVLTYRVGVHVDRGGSLIQ